MDQSFDPSKCSWSSENGSISQVINQDLARKPLLSRCRHLLSQISFTHACMHQGNHGFPRSDEGSQDQQNDIDTFCSRLAKRQKHEKEKKPESLRKSFERNPTTMRVVSSPLELNPNSTQPEPESSRTQIQGSMEANAAANLPFSPWFRVFLSKRRSVGLATI